MTKLARESYILIGLCLADLISTLCVLSSGDAIEGNPIMSAFLALGVVPFIFAKAALVALPLIILEWARRRSPQFVSSMLRLTIVLYLGFYGAGVWRLNSVNPMERPADRLTDAKIEWAAATPTPTELTEARVAMQQRTAQLP